jgi:putative flippase GtrA
MRGGLEPAWARVVSLACAVNATFVVNGLVVFRGLKSGREFARQWLTYVATNAFGNLCNYWIFVTLVSLHHPVASAPSVALCAAAASAWAINYAAARLLVFGAGLGALSVFRRLRPESPSPIVASDAEMEKRSGPRSGRPA